MSEESQPRTETSDELQLFETRADPTLVARNLVDDFVVPPFSVLDTRQGYWQKRARQWMGLGIKSELGRSGALLGGFLAMKNEAYGRENEETLGISIFDPVLCEIAYRWFAPPGGLVLDPFAGGSVRGVVAQALGLRYNGIELREEQVEANREQANELFRGEKPRWVCGNSAEVLAGEMSPADLIFTCPPYADLEVYSDDPADLSFMTAADFEAAYRSIIVGAVGHLKQDRFAVVVIGNVRNKDEHLRDLVRLTTQSMEDAGASFYNEIILVNAVGTGAVRARKPMQASRKIVKMHQSILVFVKGDPHKAAEGFGPIGELV